MSAEKSYLGCSPILIALGRVDFRTSYDQMADWGVVLSKFSILTKLYHVIYNIPQLDKRDSTEYLKLGNRAPSACGSQKLFDFNKTMPFVIYIYCFVIGDLDRIIKTYKPHPQ